MAFTASFIYKAVDRITPTLDKIDRRTKASQRLVVSNFKKQTIAAEKYKKSLKSIGRVTGFMTIGITAGLAVITREGARYEDALASLSAITGLTGRTLDSMSGNIKNTSKEFGLGASDIAKGMELIGSKQPILLQTPKLLLAVARSAAILSKASGEDFATSGENLADVMNQFSLTGKDADRVINSLAASAKLGASQIPELTRGIIEAGTSAKAAGLSIEQTASILEILAEKGIKGARAGLQLKNTLTKLESSGVRNLTPSLVGLDKALENLANQELSTKEITKKFGLENLNTVRTIIESRNQISKFAIAITGTNIAYEQAAIRMNTFSEKAKRLRAAIGVELINAFEELKPALISILETIKTIIPIIVDFAKENKFLIKAFLVMTPLIFLTSKALLFFSFVTTTGTSAILAMRGTKLGLWMIQAAAKTRIGAFAMQLFGSSTAKALIALTIITLAIVAMVKAYNAWKALKAAEALEKETGAYAKGNEQILKRFRLLNKLRKEQGRDRIRIKDVAERTNAILKSKGQDGGNLLAFSSARLQAVNERISAIKKPNLTINNKDSNSKVDVGIKIEAPAGSRISNVTTTRSGADTVGKTEVR